MCRAVQSEGVKVLIATTDADGPNRLPVQLGARIEYLGVPTIFFSRQFSEAFKYSHSLAQWLDESVDSFHLVHIHAVFSHSTIAAAHACARKNIPYIVRPLGSLDPWSLRQKHFAKTILWRMGIQRMLNHAAAIHYTTNEEKCLAERTLGINSGVVIPLGVQQDLLHGDIDGAEKMFPSLEKSPYILSLSRIHPKKNIESLLEAFSSVTRVPQYKHWKLVIAGAGDPIYVEHIRQLARQHCGNNVMFTGWLTGTDKAILLKGASLFVLVSHQENFGLSVVEAMAKGVPVLVSDHVNLSDEIASAGAGWVVHLERGSLRQILLETLSDKLERTARGAAAENLARSRYTWPAVANELYGLYQRVQSEQSMNK